MRFVFLGLGGLCGAFCASLSFADIPTGISALERGDVPAAASAFQAGFQEGDGDGAFYLGRLFELGVGIDADMDRATQLYAAAAAAGSALAQNRLGLMYL